ncbi:hypothetical protein Aca07nite_00030 [Actinoplanes capillaceus]|uniref:STAS domain-containing protein n=1 Tax=Actinoplanes campanulatus TaxID=113559 RepID=A0ABQ3W979_9ACTN|nr:STAS domain-containing protein [Actinoplanes capillaceus]GID42728.1 hypothetical protein Aca07nite_00030 [Actinoplanes capillaceus]
MERKDDLNTVRIEERGGAAVVAIRGRIDATSARLLRDALAWAVSCHERVVVDLSRAVYIDRAGLSVLIAAQDRANTRTVQLCFTAPSPRLLSSLCELRAAQVLTAAEPAAARPEPQPGGFTLPRPSAALRFAVPAST